MRQHIVEKGDNLTHIARKYGISLPKLRKANKKRFPTIRSMNKIKVGEIINIPEDESSNEGKEENSYSSKLFNEEIPMFDGRIIVVDHEDPSYYSQEDLDSLRNISSWAGMTLDEGFGELLGHKLLYGKDEEGRGQMLSLGEVPVTYISPDSIATVKAQRPPKFLTVDIDTPSDMWIQGRNNYMNIFNEGKTLDQLNTYPIQTQLDPAWTAGTTLVYYLNLNNPKVYEEGMLPFSEKLESAISNIEDNIRGNVNGEPQEGTVKVGHLGGYNNLFINKNGELDIKNTKKINYKYGN